MNKIVLLLLLIPVFWNCKSTTATQLDKKAEIMMKGNWKIESVDFTGSEYFKVNSFEIADSKCMEGSEWKFVSNNNKGTIKLNKSKCPSYESNITWFVNREGNVVMKILDDQKARKVKEGYVLKLINQTENSFEWIDYITIGKNKGELKYKFVRI